MLGGGKRPKTHFHNIVMSIKIKFIFTLLIFLSQASGRLCYRQFPFFSVPMLNFQINPTVEVCWPPKSNNDRA